MEHHEHCHLPENFHRLSLSQLLIDHNIKILGQHKEYNVYQIDVLKQSDSFSCGYHTFNNALLTLKGKKINKYIELILFF